MITLLGPLERIALAYIVAYVLVVIALALWGGVFAFTVTMVDGDDTATLVSGSVTVL